MNDHPDTSVAPPPAAGAPLLPERVAPHRKRMPAVAVAVAVIALVWIGGGFYLLSQELAESNRRLAAQEVATAAARQEAARLGERVERAENQLGNVVTSDLEDLHSQQQSIEDLLDSLRDKVERNPQLWTTTEAAHLLRIANDRLHLDGDIATALVALETADQRLHGFNDPSLFEVRRALAAEIAALRAAPAVDITGVGLRLGSLNDGIERLPFPHAPGALVTATDADTAPQGWRKVMHDLWQELRKLVVIKHKDQPDQALLTPDEREVLQQNLRLTLETAQVALLRRNDPLFHDSLRRARAWLERYFDRDAPAVQNTLQELARMDELRLAAPPPDISASLRALEDWQTQRRNPPRRSGENAP